jgi:orotidine-5'-phosphate decarboxylase
MQSSAAAPRDRLIVGLDLPSVDAAEAMIARLGESVTFYKIGYQLAYAGGLPLVPRLVSAGKKVFVDLKLHDIGNTVARGVESVAKLGATFLTVHAYPQTMKAAVEGRAGSELKILAVTVLTSYDDDDLHAAGYRIWSRPARSRRRCWASMDWSARRRRRRTFVRSSACG